MSATNSEVAEKLGVSHSTVSRMRSGTRIGSTTVLQRLSSEYDIPLTEVVTAAVEARAGNLENWTRVMSRVTGD